MTTQCEHCYTPIVDDRDLVEYDELPYHRDCMKEMFREDNPDLEQEKYDQFDKYAEKVDKFERNGNILIPIMWERKSDSLSKQNAQGE